MEFDPSCIALLEQKGNLMVDLAETRAKLQKLDRGLLTRELLKEDPYYSYLLEQRDRYQTRIHSTAHRMEELKELTGEVPPDNQMQNITVTSEPVNINWPLNTAVAGVLGLMLSVFIVFTKPFVAELKEELKEKE